MEIRIDYNQVIQQAHHISEEAGRISRNITKLDEVIHQIGASWKGPASQTFLKKCQELKQEMIQSQKKVAQLAETIEAIANRIRQEDEEANQRAKQLPIN